MNRLDLMRHYNDDGDNVWEQGVDTLLSEFDYTVRADGKRTAVDEKVFDGTTSKATRVDWLYDNIGRLTQEDYNADGASLGFTADYLFDLIGNRLEKSVDQGRDSVVDETTDYVYDTNDRLLTETKDATVDSHTVYTYDDTQQNAKDVYTDATLTTPVATTDYEYNRQGRMSRVELDADGNGTPETRLDYEYDASGIRVAQTKGRNCSAAEGSPCSMAERIRATSVMGVAFGRWKSACKRDPVHDCSGSLTLQAPPRAWRATPDPTAGGSRIGITLGIVLGTQNPPPRARPTRPGIQTSNPPSRDGHRDAIGLREFGGFARRPKNGLLTT